jgi:hypothetical protein
MPALAYVEDQDKITSSFLDFGKAMLRLSDFHGVYRG